MRGRGRRGRSHHMLRSDCGELKVKGHARQIAQQYERLAKHSEDDTLIQTYLQQAEHYNREAARVRAERAGHRAMR